MRIADLDVSTVYRVTRPHVGRQPGVLIYVETWHERWPTGSAAERPYVLHLRYDDPAPGYFAPRLGAHGLPVLLWTRSPEHGEFGSDEHEALLRAARAVRLRWRDVTASVDARQTREALVGEIGEDGARCVGLALCLPNRILAPWPTPSTPALDTLPS